MPVRACICTCSQQTYAELHVMYPDAPSYTQTYIQTDASQRFMRAGDGYIHTCIQWPSYIHTCIQWPSYIHTFIPAAAWGYQSTGNKTHEHRPNMSAASPLPTLSPRCSPPCEGLCVCGYVCVRVCVCARAHASAHISTVSPALCNSTVCV
jgi:hypothetical protein